MDLGSRWELDRVGPDDWRRWSSVRLAALADAPEAFSSSLEVEESFDEARWRQRLTGGARVVARVLGGDVGLVGVHLSDGPDRPQLYGLWVHPVWRGIGLADALVVEVLAWARETGHDHVGLWVMDDNEGARRLYDRHGFRPDPDPAAPPPGGCEVSLRHDLAVPRTADRTVAGDG